MTETFLVPVGHDLGPWPGTEPGEFRFQVRAGDQVLELDNLRFAVWLLAHDGAPPRRDDVLAAAEALGVDAEQAGAALEGLLADGLVAEIGDPASSNRSARRFAEEHRLVPLMLGLRPDAEDADLRIVGLLDVPLVQVSAALYDLWLWAHLSPDLWRACTAAAGPAGSAGPDEVLSEVLAAVHPLLASRAAYLDRVLDRVLDDAEVLA